ncbi:unnamed protein product [Rhizophagus irregularis]|nr:unnamed protein product [Rhizophagus irregularis]
MFLEQLTGITNSCLINWVSLNLKQFRKKIYNSYKPPKWFKELQNIVTIDGKHLKNKYKTSSTSHMKGYKIDRITQNNIPNGLTYVGIWNKKADKIELGIFNKKSGIDSEKNLIINHFNIIENNDDGSDNIKITKCMGCDLENYDYGNKNPESSGCNFLVNTDDVIIIGKKIQRGIDTKDIKKISFANLIDITDFSYNDFKFKNGWNKYESSKDLKKEENKKIKEKNKNNIIYKLIDTSRDRNELMKIQKDLLIFENTNKKFDVYTDGSVRCLGTEQYTMAFGFIFIENGNISQKFRSEVINFPTSTKVELIAMLSALIVLPKNSQITIYTDSNNIITGYYDIINRYNFRISPRRFFKIKSNNVFWSMIQEIMITNNLTLDFVKIKSHSNDLFNNYIDEYIKDTDENSILEFKYNNLKGIDYIPRWNNIIIEKGLRKFFKNLGNINNFEKFLNLNRNGKYRRLNIDWKTTFTLLEGDRDESTFVTSLSSSKKKKQLITLLMEELPTVEKMKYLALRIYNTWKCPFCEQYDETFDHLWTCNNKINEIKEIINEIKQFIKNTSNMLLINEEKIPTVTESAVDLINCWDITFSNSKITFIDLIKGIIPCELTKFVKEYFNIKNTRLTFLKELRDFIFEKIWAFWINRCVI